ncbi:MAG: nucleotidyltransferase domain-containing protein [Armatimonadetes bacterium]|nr:nucleotidyltransferase domain-containing protein [Armatimonadota bacterium]
MVERIVAEFAPLRIVLFGSQARGDTHSDSDVDLLVVMPDGSANWSTRVAIRRALSHFPVAKDIVVTTPEEIRRRGCLPGTVLQPALEEGRTLYESV